MKTKLRFFPIVLFTIFVVSMQSSASDDDLYTLLYFMEGSFSSEEQALNDSDYFDIRLEMKRIWSDRTDGYWLYVEQAVAEYREKPYRQRVYRLYESNGKLASDIYELEDEEKFAGAYLRTELFDDLTPDDLKFRLGCTVFLERVSADEFKGGTLDNNCISTLRGAAYATTEVTITPDMMISWDRGFDETGTQVWGTDKGGYIFRKLR